MKNTAKHWTALAWLGLIVAVCLLSLPACTKAAQWRNSQIAQSHASASGSGVKEPSTPVEVPDDVLQALPVDSAFTILSFSDDGSRVQLQALSAWDAQRTSEYVLSTMGSRDYTEADNPSSLLSSGLLFENAQADFKAVMVKVGLNTADQCTLEISADR